MPCEFVHLILYFHITFPVRGCSNSCCVTALLHASGEYKWANNCDDVWCVVTFCHATRHSLMSVSDTTTLARNKSQQNTRVQSYYRHKIYYWSHYEGAHTRWLLKYLAQCETINYVWYFQERVWPRPECTYLPRARNSTCWSVNFQKAIDMNLCEGSEHSAHHMKYDSNKLQQNHFYMCSIDIIANTMQHF